MNITRIGTIHSPFTLLEKMPIQPKGAAKVEGWVEIEPQYREGLRDLEGFSHIYLLYQFHQAPRTELTVIPFMDTVKRGVFSTRSPIRPNHIGISVVKLLGINDNVLKIEGVDILDGTPLIDIKPYIEAFDQIPTSTSGWMTADSAQVAAKRSDSRFR